MKQVKNMEVTFLILNSSDIYCRLITGSPVDASTKSGYSFLGWRNKGPLTSLWIDDYFLKLPLLKHSGDSSCGPPGLCQCTRYPHIKLGRWPLWLGVLECRLRSCCSLSVHLGQCPACVRMCSYLSVDTSEQMCEDSMR